MDTSYSDFIIDGIEKRCCFQRDHFIKMTAGAFNDNMVEILIVQISQEPKIEAEFFIFDQELQIYLDNKIIKMPFFMPNLDDLTATINRVKLLLVWQ